MCTHPYLRYSPFPSLLSPLSNTNTKKQTSIPVPFVTYQDTRTSAKSQYSGTEDASYTDTDTDSTKQEKEKKGKNMSDNVQKSHNTSPSDPTHNAAHEEKGMSPPPSPTLQPSH